MPWTCPACSEHVHPEHDDGQDLPRTGIVYRCPVCKLELVYDPLIDNMRAASVPPEPKKPDAA